MSNTERNDPCPCGSGKKYKHCCGDGVAPTQTLNQIDPFFLNKEVAYLGKIGQARKRFCESYIRAKANTFSSITAGFSEKSISDRTTIRCHKGCSYCCSQYVSVVVQEAEGIVYYLYQNPQKLERYLKVYPEWREKIRQNESFFKNIGLIHRAAIASKFAPAENQKYWEAAGQYLKQDIACPFLHENECDIYPVRPLACASIVATSDPIYCKAHSEVKPSIYIVSVGDLSSSGFYTSFYTKMDTVVWTQAPLAVYELLKNGLMWLHKIPELDNLDQEFLRQPEVQMRLRHLAILR